MQKTWSLMTMLRAGQAAVFVFVAWAFFLYPAGVTARAVFSSEMRETAQSPTLLRDYRATAGRYKAWAKNFWETERAVNISSHDVAGTEWPMFGSVFELDPREASAWFSAYVENFWKPGWVSGFREMPHGQPAFSDVDSGPSLFGVGSVATGLRLGAARSVGRYDYAVPLAMEIVPASWPTPFGLVLPGVMGWAAADGWCFGELALQFSMTRPNLSGQVTKYKGGVPEMVWVFLLLYAAGAGLVLWGAWATGRRVWSPRQERSEG